MKKLPAWLDTTTIEAQFVIANTPNFIVRRIKEDKIPYLLSKNMPPNSVLKLFVESLEKKPDDLRELVTPYICLAALSLAPDLKFLRDAILFTPRPNYKWLRPFAQILIDTYRPTTFVSVRPPAISNLAIMTSRSSSNYGTFVIK